MTNGLVRLLASGFGSGYFPFASGTAGTLASIPFAWALSLASPTTQILFLVLGLWPAALVCGRAAKISHNKDPGWVVIDEFFGFFYSVAFITPTILSYGAAFFLFRLFDIVKPPPAGWFDRELGGGWGILLDDVAAGMMTRLTLALLFYWAGAF